MQDVSFRRLLGTAFLAALFASTVGSALLFGDEFAAHPLRRLMGEHYRYPPPSLSDLLFYPGLWMISCFGTVPGSMLIGAPAIYPFRNMIAQHPYIAALPTVAYAVIVSTLLLGWTVTPTAYGAKHFEIIWYYSAAAALGFVVVLGHWGHKQAARNDSCHGSSDG